MQSLTDPTILEQIGQLASELTPPSEIAALLDIDVDQLRGELVNKHSPVHKAYYAAKAKTANMLRKGELEFARAGALMAVMQASSYLRDMTSDEDL